MIFYSLKNLLALSHECLITNTRLKHSCGVSVIVSVRLHACLLSCSTSQQLVFIQVCLFDHRSLSSFDEPCESKVVGKLQLKQDIEFLVLVVVPMHRTNRFCKYGYSSPIVHANPCSHCVL